MKVGDLIRTTCQLVGKGDDWSQILPAKKLGVILKIREYTSPIQHAEGAPIREEQYQVRLIDDARDWWLFKENIEVLK